MEDKLDLLTQVEQLRSNDYLIISTKQEQEKRFIAKDFEQTSSGKRNFLTDDYSSSQKALILTSLYLIPLSTTGIISAFAYSRSVFLAKRLLRLKSFFSTNLFAFSFLLFINVNTFSLTQAYIGSLYLSSAYSLHKTPDPSFCSLYYHLIKQYN